VETNQGLFYPCGGSLDFGNGLDYPVLRKEKPRGYVGERAFPRKTPGLGQ